MPAGLLHPRRVLEGVHRGIVDGGNQSGIPVVAGGFVFDESYLGKPLVFCGTGGILPARVRGRPSWERAVRPGDLAVMVGGRIGKDGIHGATFSSEALSASSPTSAVQIGDPITQKKACDLLLEARDLGLYRGLTDNGAGGLSSSLGEMATLSGGVRIDLDRCPLKYAGLAPWEILLSESQERMSLAVPPAHLDGLPGAGAAARRRGRGRRRVHRGRLRRGDLGRPARGAASTSRSSTTDCRRWSCARSGSSPAAGRRGCRRAAVPRPPPRRPDLASALRAILADPNVRSREEWVRQYDHEVQGRSVVKPFVGVAARGAERRRGAAPAARLTARHHRDARHRARATATGTRTTMARCAVDEAVRAHVALGGDPERMAGLDNFCWPDPVEAPDNPDGAYKLAQLVRACRGLADACARLRAAARLGQGLDEERRPGRRAAHLGAADAARVPDGRRPRRAPGADHRLQAAGRRDLAAWARRGASWAARVYERIAGAAPRRLPVGRARRQRCASYRRFHRAARRGLVASCHDLSDGGLWVALAESALGGGLGADVSLDAVPRGPAAVGRAAAVRRDRRAGSS